MAGDWIKMTHALPEKPEVLEIVGRTTLNRFEVVGRLFTLWRWFDVNTVDGNARGVTKVTLNECLYGYSDDTNFVSAVIEARWLHESEGGIRVVNFDEHISESAKTRGQTAKRVAKSKSKAANAVGNAKTVTKTVPREEKRREDKETPTGFALFWSTWPTTDRKQAKGKCLDAWKKASAERDAAVVVAHVERMKASAEWLKDGGQYIPSPLVYLNQRRWEGAEDDGQAEQARAFV